MKCFIAAEFDPAINPAFKEPLFTETTVEAARQLEAELVWWRPSGVVSETPEQDICLVRVG